MQDLLTLPEPRGALKRAAEGKNFGIRLPHRGAVVFEIAIKRAARLPGRLRLAQWGQLYLLRKPVGGRQVAVVLDEHAPHDEHGIVR